MENSPYPFSTPSPHPPPPHPKTSQPVLYYGLVIVGTAAIVLAIYNLIIIKWCANHQRRLRNMNRSLEGTSLSRGLDNSSINLGASFKYKKEGADSLQLGYDNYECPVCLSVFEEEEEVRQLPRCKHSFHAPCIDMWLYSHLDCPLCRSPVELPVFPRQTKPVSTPSEHSREVLIEQGILV